MNDRETALFANAAFYAAFGARDMKAMEDVWSRDQPVSCIHPGWPAVHGRTEVMSSWAGILSGRNPPRIVCRADRAELLGNVAVVTCVEIINGQGTLAATNIFVKAGPHWAMVHHQAGPANVDLATLPQPDEAQQRKSMN